METLKTVQDTLGNTITLSKLEDNSACLQIAEFTLNFNPTKENTERLLRQLDVYSKLIEANFELTEWELMEIFDSKGCYLTRDGYQADFFALNIDNGVFGFNFKNVDNMLSTLRRLASHT